MNINWSVRLKSKTFWLGLVGVIGAFAVNLAALFGVDLDVTTTESAATMVISAVFAVLSLCGVVVDPTTSGLTDSAQAMTYTSPKED
jgi:phi LC3 family holin